MGSTMEDAGGEGRWTVRAYPLDEPATLGQLGQTLVRDLPATGHVQALELAAVLGNGDDRGFGDIAVARYVQSRQVLAAPEEGRQAHIGQAVAVGQGQALDAGAHGQGYDAAVIHAVGEGGEIQALDEGGVGEEGPLESEGGADGGVLLPGDAGGPVPEDLDDVACPSLTGQHAVEELLGVADAREDADEDLAGEGSDGRETVGVGDLHVLEVGHDAEGGLGVVVREEEIRLLVVGGGWRVGGRGGPRISRILDGDGHGKLTGLCGGGGSRGGSAGRVASCDDIERRGRRARHPGSGTRGFVSDGIKERRRRVSTWSGQLSISGQMADGMPGMGVGRVDLVGLVGVRCCYCSTFLLVVKVEAGYEQLESEEITTRLGLVGNAMYLMYSVIE